MRSVRAVALVLAALVSTSLVAGARAGVGPAAASAAAQSRVGFRRSQTEGTHRNQPCASVRRTGAWQEISLPLDAAAYAVLPSGTILAGGGNRVMSSDDGGCSWSTSLTAPAEVTVAGGGVVALAASGTDVYAALTGPRVLISRDAGRTWAPADGGLPPGGAVHGIYPAPSGNVVYLVVEHAVTDEVLDTAGAGQTGTSVRTTTLYRKTPGAADWAAVGSPGAAWDGPAGSDSEGVVAPGAFWDLAVDPASAGHLLAVVKGGIARSLDGGRTWTAVLADPSVEARTVSVAGGAGGGLAAVVVDPASGMVYETASVSAGVWSTHDHAALRTERMTSYPHARAWAWSELDPATGEAYVSGPKGVFRLASGAITDLTPAALGPGDAPLDLTHAAGTIWARLLDGSRLLSLDVERDPWDRPDEPGGVTPGITPVRPELPAPGSVPVRRGAAVLTPERSEVTLAPGEATTVTYLVRTAPQATSADVYFLLDATSSMTDSIRALTRGMGDLLTRLARSGVAIRAGAASFRTYPRQVERAEVDYAYRRLRALGPVDRDFLERLYDLEGAGSSGANLTAVLQALTGAGQDLLPPGPSRADVPPGLDAGFDPAARKLIVHIADTWFGTPERGDPNGHYAPGAWPGPGFEQVSRLLADSGVEHLGVAVRPSGGGTILATADVGRDLRTLSKAASSLAPERGVDCDGDDAPDLAPGRPLVCPLERGSSGTGLTSALAGLIEAVEDPGRIAMRVLDPSPVVRAVTPGHHFVDLRAGNEVAFSVRVACGRGEERTRSVTRLGAFVRGDVAATARLAVVCGEQPAPLPPVANTPSVRPALAVLPVPPPPPPPPHSVPGAEVGPAPAPGPAQAPAPAQAPGGQPQATVVQQRQEQPQAALMQAARTVREQTQMQHAMVRASGSANAAFVTAGAACAATGLALVLAWGLAGATLSYASPRRGRRR